jgi:hypothetical protein
MEDPYGNLGNHRSYNPRGKSPYQTQRGQRKDGKTTLTAIDNPNYPKDGVRTKKSWYKGPMSEFVRGNRDNA